MQLLLVAAAAWGRLWRLSLLRHGINVAIGAKTVTSTEKIPGSIHDAVVEVEAKGAQALAVQTDVRHEEQIENLVNRTVDAFGRVDIVVNNAGAIMFLPVDEMLVKRFDLLMQLNYRAPYILCHYAVPYLKKQSVGHIINMSPPPRIGGLAADDWQAKTCYLMSKFGMSHLTMGLAEELREHNISVNSLWPKNIIDTQATRVFSQMLHADKAIDWYSPEMLADACLEIVKSDAAELTGQTLIAENFLAQKGVTEIEKYKVRNPI